MSSRETILSAVRKYQPAGTAHPPDLQGDWIHYPDPEQQFCDVLASVGGQAHRATNAAEASQIIAALPCMNDAKQVVCQVPELQFGNYDLNQVQDPHELRDIDVAILPGYFGVAENAAVWVDDRTVKHRVVYFLTQHLVLVVPRTDMVHNLYQAYQRLAFLDRGYGLFISGPSKTADIEQSLVIGAHGPRSMHVILLGTHA
jgi:L-lactate dehydrogenase complex protein LldG